MTHATSTDTDTVASAAAAKRSAMAVAARAARTALQWRLLALWTLALLLPTALAALPLWRLLAANLDHSVHAAALAQRLDMIALADLGAVFARSGQAAGYGGVLALLLALLLSPLLSGMTVTAARAPQQPGVMALIAGGVQEYPRMLRMLLWAVVPLGVAAALAGAALSAADEYADSAVLQSAATHARFVAVAVAFLLVALANATLDAGRAVLAADRRRKSAVVAWWHGFKLFRRRPLAVPGIWFAMTAAGLLLAALLGVARLNVPPLGAGGLAAAFVLTQLAVATLGWMRNARLFALIELVRGKG